MARTLPRFYENKLENNNGYIYDYQFNSNVDSHNLIANRKIGIYYMRKQYKLNFEHGEPIICPRCNSGHINKSGKRYNIYSIKQEYRCRECKFHFTHDDGLLRLRSPRAVVLFAFDKARNHSCRKISKMIMQKFRYKISHSSVARWLRKYDHVYFKNPKERLEELKKKLKRYEGKIVKANIVRHAGNYSKTSHLGRLHVLTKGLIHPLGNGFWFIGNIEDYQKKKEDYILE